MDVTEDILCFLSLFFCTHQVYIDYQLNFVSFSILTLDFLDCLSSISCLKLELFQPLYSDEKEWLTFEHFEASVADLPLNPFVDCFESALRTDSQLSEFNIFTCGIK